MTATSPVLLPDVLARYLAAIASGDINDAVRHTSPDVTSALPPAGAHAETAPRREAEGRDELRAILSGSFGEAPLTVLTAAGNGAHWFLEARVDGAPAETLVGSFTVRDQQVARQLVFRCELVEPPAGDAPATPATAGGGLAAVERYFEQLEAADMGAAVECFSRDTLYSHPPYKHAPEEGRAEFRGHGQLLAGFERRGYRTVRHELLAHAQAGAQFFVEGSTDDPPGGGSFVSSVTLDADGRIQRYVALFTQPRIPFDAR